MRGKFLAFSMLALGCTLSSYGDIVVANKSEKIQSIRLIEDDAQNYMVSKVFELQHQKANDLVPFILGAVKRYAKNSTVDRINYSAADKQLVAVTCPVPLMPYIDDMIAKLDRPSTKGPNGSGIAGTGITRSYYSPKYRSSEAMMNVMIKAGIPSNATSGAAQDALVAFDAATNMIYWKDSGNKSADMHKYLNWLDRPIPQVSISLNVYELRDSDLQDIGIDYLAWKNGPGLNLLDAGATFLEGSALANSFGPYGFFAFAPAFDFSFVRMLADNGKATINTAATLTLVNGADAHVAFSPDYQNLVKDSDFATTVTSSLNDSIDLNIVAPIIALTGATDKNGLLGYTQEDYDNQIAVVNFNYDITMRNVVERSVTGEELFEESEQSSSVSIQSGGERVLTQWVKENEIEQTIGVPFLCEVPVLKYLFGTTTTLTEKHYYYLTVKAELVYPDAELAQINGKLVAIPELNLNNGNQ